MYCTMSALEREKERCRKREGEREGESAPERWIGDDGDMGLLYIIYLCSAVEVVQLTDCVSARYRLIQEFPQRTLFGFVCCLRSARAAPFTVPAGSLHVTVLMRGNQHKNHVICHRRGAIIVRSRRSRSVSSSSGNRCSDGAGFRCCRVHVDVTCSVLPVVSKASQLVPKEREGGQNEDKFHPLTKLLPNI